MAAAAVMVAGVWLPWAHVTFRLFGVESPAVTVHGNDVGSERGSFPWGWLRGGAGLVGLIAVVGGKPPLALGAGLAGVVVTIVSLSTLDASRLSVSVGGRDVSDALASHVTPA